MVRKKAAVCGEERCVTSLTMAAKEIIVLVECEKNGGWRSVFEFRGENLDVLCYFCSGFYTARRQIDGKIRYVAIFFLFEKNMWLMSIKFAFIWWYFCI